MESAIRVRELRAACGGGWLAAGWHLVRRAPAAWAGLSAGWVAITLGLVFLPFIGAVAANLLQPAFFASFALAADKQVKGGRLDMGDLFAGFRRPLRPLLHLGAILLLAELAIFLVMSLLGLPGIAKGSTDPATINDYVAALEGKEWILLVGFALTALIKGALWFAPALLAFHDLSTAHAARWSVFAALSNVGAMMVYGVLLTLAFAAAILPWGLGLIVAVPVMVASTYSGFAEVFESLPAPGGAAAQDVEDPDR